MQESFSTEENFSMMSGWVQAIPLHSFVRTRLQPSVYQYSDMLIRKVNQSIHLVYQSGPYRFLFVFLVVL